MAPPLLPADPRGPQQKFRRISAGSRSVPARSTRQKCPTLIWRCSHKSQPCILEKIVKSFPAVEVPKLTSALTREVRSSPDRGGFGVISFGPKLLRRTSFWLKQIMAWFPSAGALILASFMPA
jgi:hypothetical protein